MELTPEMLDAYLRILKENGVAEFIGNGIAVKFCAPGPEPEAIAPDKEANKAAKSMWENENLWPDGKPPSFNRKA